ncbi:MAG: hypothetical protein IJL02_10375 [Methanobrevibacter sp.]|uniref:HIRAN domain-containing protein n=1 Tax=Methanobrevibacter sp. TaxID=66852 RepID=UPI0025E8E8E4|nr:HIRAN domain-containing protein [Methanobrevibacter sp.]MBQ6100249.1 hypothetical protein [Methanobrevibacter sp.]
MQDQKSKSLNDTYQSKLAVETSPADKALRLLDEKRFDDALDVIDDGIKKEKNNPGFWNIKGLIFDSKKDYENAVECFNKSLKISDDSEILLNRANSLYKWAKITFFPEGNLSKAMDLIDEALESLPEGEDSSELWFLKGEIYQGEENNIQARKCFLKAEGRIAELEELENELNQFEKYSGETLINITGTNFYKGLEPFTPNAVFKLIKDTENEHDRDAIAVMDDSQIVGYVANSDYTVRFDVESASKIKNRIRDTSTVEVLFIFQNEYVIGRVIF